MKAARSFSRSNLGSILMATVSFVAVTACVTPAAMHGNQTMPLREGDSFQLLVAPAHNAALDAKIFQMLEGRFSPNAIGSKWFVEYSYAIRPARIAIKSDAMDQSKSVPKSDALLACNDLSHRLSVRFISANDGTQAYRGTAEILTCGNGAEQNEVIFEELLNNALNGLTIERPAG